MKWLLLGAKEYPFGAGSREDPLPSGGYEKYAEQLAEALADAGQDVHIVTRKFRKPAKEAPANTRIHVHRVPWISGKLLRNPTFNTATMLKAARLDFDVILAQGIFGTMAGMILKKIKNKPLISMPAGVAYSQPQHGTWVSGALRKLERHAYRHADAVVFLSDQEREQFHAKLGFLPSHSAVIAPGVIVPEKPLSRNKNKKLQLLFVGRLIAVKGLQFLLPAMKNLDAQLTIVGNGPQEAELRAQAEELGLKNVTFAGYHADPSSFYRKSDAVVLPSLSEGLPLSALEAAANGLALIVTDIGLPFENGKVAVVVPPKDSNALNSVIAKLSGKPDLRRKLGQNARQFVSKNYSWKKTAHALQKLAATLE